MLFKAGISLVITLAIIGTAWEISAPPRPRILYNPSASAPIGFYRLNVNAKIERGDRVAAYAPEWARKLAHDRDYLPYDYPLIKSVVAISGDDVCFTETSVRVPNGLVIPVQVRDRLGRDMPRQSVGCSTLSSDELFIASPDVQSGFDSRYFGPVSQESVLGTVDFLGALKNAQRTDSDGFEGIER